MPFTFSLKSKSKGKNDVSPGEKLQVNSNPSTLQRTKKHEPGLTVVKFESEYPTEIWQASPSPSPTLSEKLDRKRVNYRKNMRSWHPTDTEDSSDDTGTSVSGQSRDHSDELTNSSTSSTSSLDEVILSGQEKRRRRKRRHNKLKVQTPNLSSSSSSSDTSNEDANLEWSPKKVKNVSNVNPAVMPATPYIMPMCNPPTPMNTPRMYNPMCPVISSPNQWKSAPHQMNQSHTNMCHQFIPNCIVSIVGDYLPSIEWQRQYKVLTVRVNEYAFVEKQPPKTEKDLKEGASSWLLVRKWCCDHKAPVGQQGFIPKYLCRRLNESEYVKFQQSGLPSPSHFNRISMTASNTESMSGMNQDTISGPPTWNIPTVSYPSSSLNPNIPDKNSSELHNNGPGSFSVYGVEHEDRDSGRGPSSGSEWGSGRGGSSTGALDATLDDQDNVRLSQGSWDKNESEYWTQQGQTSVCSSNHSPTKIPPPMAPLKSDITPRLFEKLNSLSLNDPDRTPTTQHFDLINRHSMMDNDLSLPKPINNSTSLGRPTTMTSSNSKVEQSSQPKSGESSTGTAPLIVAPDSNPASWEPYKTMIQVSEDTLEKFTLV